MLSFHNYLLFYWPAAVGVDCFVIRFPLRFMYDKFAQIIPVKPDFSKRFGFQG